MRAKTNMVFLDLKCNELRRQGQVFELSCERFAEINGKIPGALAELGGCEGGGEPDSGDEPGEAEETVDLVENEGESEHPDLDEMTCEQLREYIASRGGEAPSKAKRAELDAIARTL